MSISDEELNEDWLKTMSWDLGFTDLAGLLHYLMVGLSPPTEQEKALRHFMDLAAWRSAPPELKREAGAWLSSH